jgi:acetylornithine deacetylase/succinyl-diaminopimelate desuccinylase-like protein
MKMEMELSDLTKGALQRLVNELLKADEEKEKQIMDRYLKKGEKNDLADLDEEMHGKPDTPEVEEDDLPKEGLADIPRRKKKKKDA